MTNHLKRPIRERIVADVRGLATTGANVFEDRGYPMGEAKLPCLLVYDSGDKIEILTISPAGTRSMLTIFNMNIEAYANGADGLMDLNTWQGAIKRVNK